MERWAKAQNKRNESSVGSKAALAEPAGGAKGEGGGTGAADAAFAVLLERRDRAALVEKQAQVFHMHMKKEAPPVSNFLPKFWKESIYKVSNHQTGICRMYPQY